MQKKRGNPGRGKGGGHFLSDQTGFTDSGHNHPTSAIEDETNGSFEVVIQPPGHIQDGGGLFFNDFPAFIN
jgi:hypothetical protein